MSLEFVNVKEELEFEVDVIEGPREESYMDHEVKCELDIGPELVLAPNVPYMFQGVTEQDVCASGVTEQDACVLVEQPIQDTIQCDIKLLKSCFVRLERLPVRMEFLERLMKNNSRKLIFACELCSYAVFQCRYQLRRHKVTHIKQLLRSNYENVALYFGFITKDDDDDDYTHMGYKTYFCDICLRKFINEIDLSNHMHIHEELQNSTLSEENERKLREQLYPERNMLDFYGKYERTEGISSFCISCGTVVRATLEGFARHLIPHVEENPVLKQLLKDFTNRSRVKSVRNEYYDFERRKIYTCPYCHYMFVKNTNYKRHMEVHTKNSNKNMCEICHKILPSLEMLLQHKYEHNDDSFPPISIEAYSLKKPNEVYTLEQPKETIPTNYQPTSDLPYPAGVSQDNHQDKERDLKPNKESIDFQKSSLFSRLKLLNQTLNSNVVGKSSDCPK